MKSLNDSQLPDYIETATIEQTYECGHAIVHVGVNAFGARFVMLNDSNGDTVVSEGL